jgi:hypothetical protein
MEYRFEVIDTNIRLQLLNLTIPVVMVCAFASLGTNTQAYGPELRLRQGYVR